MRLLIFSITFRPFVGGAEIALEEILRRIPTVTASVITARLDASLPAEERYSGIMIYRVGKGKKLDKYLYVFRALRLAKKLHAKEAFDGVQALIANYAGIAALFFKKRFPTVPYLLTLQSGDSSFFIWIRTFWFYPVYRQVYARADFIQSISKYLMQRAKSYGFSGHGDVIPNGVDMHLFAQPKSKEELAAVRAELGIAADEKIIVTTSRLVYKNGIDQLLLGFDEWVHKANVRARLLIIGKGKDEKSLRKLAARLTTGNKVLFLGEKPYAILPLYLQMSDMFVRPSRSEGMGNSFIEAMAAGIPVVGTNVGGIVDFIEHKQTGMLVDRDNPYAIARAIHTVMTNPALRVRLVENGKKVIQGTYEWDSIAVRMEKVYRSLCRS